MILNYYIKIFKLKGIISKFYEFIEKIAIIFLDKLCTVTPIIAEKYPQDKVFLVRNFVSKSFCKSPNYKFETNEKISGIFVGGLTRNRLIHNLINAAGQLNGEMDLRLIGKWESQEYKDQCAKLFGWKFVDYIGFIPNQEVQDYIRTADIGFHILEPKSNYLQGMYPTKVFEYFACGVPVIMPKWFKRLCIYDDSAFFVDPENMKEIITTLRYINLYKWRLREKGKNAYNLVQQKMNWESEFEVLISNYMQLIDKRR
jgi:glycosyltransferase involved in cell wall biosynthesis